MDYNEGRKEISRKLFSGWAGGSFIAVNEAIRIPKGRHASTDQRLENLLLFAVSFLRSPKAGAMIRTIRVIE